jgi:hypothetical protein
VRSFPLNRIVIDSRSALVREPQLGQVSRFDGQKHPHFLQRPGVATPRGSINDDFTVWWTHA